MTRRRALLFVLLAEACTRPASTPPRAGSRAAQPATGAAAHQEGSTPAAAGAKGGEPAAGSGRQGPVHPGAQREGASQEDVARARSLVDQGVKLYREGEYEHAEDVLKQAITIYPFMADANLVLAKILLIRASATRDMTLYTNARLMLEMARALEPGSREVEQLLELVRQPIAQ